MLMPETAVDEYNRTILRENKIGFADELRGMIEQRAKAAGTGEQAPQQRR